ncbi:hypothetical protein [Streptomyces sp. H39-C1]|uniref:hypothetical protein n=1 Tax=Streptomyces sp. H39-C1 TaxID=3004355 RepID=UPI0022AEE3FE|nr:hypothetical protein [Streptomyces sp. H39-C1]MCZ4098012.1 hypothetical protein [Streptomyces sp. H39-C1]
MRWHRPLPAAAPGKPERRSRHFFSSTWKRDLCDDCKHSEGLAREQRVLFALPTKVMRACGGMAPANVMRLIRAELEYRTPQQLIDRIERRWWGGWSNRPLTDAGDEGSWEAYGPDNVALWLVTPTQCDGDCEDGWVRDNPDEQCPVCHPPRPHRPLVEPMSPVAEDMMATARSVVRDTQAPRSRAEYVPTAATETPAQEAERARQRAERDRRNATKRDRGEITAVHEAQDPVWAAAAKRAREERQNRGRGPGPER